MIYQIKLHKNRVKRVGIYKIESPSGRIYIGQSHDLDIRFNLYEKLNCPGQRLLIASFRKYDHAAHKIEIIHELPIDVEQKVLDDYEILYYELYKDCGCRMMNLKEPGKGGTHCEETRKLISSKITGRTFSAEHLRKMSENMKGEKHIFYGKKATAEHCANISNALKGKPKTKEHSEKVSKALMGKYKGVKKPEGHGAKVSAALKGRVFTEDHKKNIGLKSKGRNIKAVTQTDKNGVVVKEWESIVLAAETLNINSSNIVNCVKGKQKSYKGYHWRYKPIGTDPGTLA